jgi:predicted nuclease of restriction endonuclease-like (RecB) superfamily
MAKRNNKSSATRAERSDRYAEVLSEISHILESARHASARTVNAIMTLTYWEIGRRIVAFEQAGTKRAAYGKELLKRLAVDLTERFGRGFSERNLLNMRRFFEEWKIPQTLSAKSSSPILALISQAPSAELPQAIFPLPWSHYVRLLSVRNQSARDFYEAEAMRGGWSIRQLERQINSQFYQRTALSKNKASMLAKGQNPTRADLLTPDDEIKDPYVLEFLDLKDEYSETDLEEALIHKLEEFLLELGGDFAFVGRQRRLRIDDEWYRIDLLFFHRKLRCLVVIDLKIGPFTHADAEQMHVYLNYAREHWSLPDENPPVGLILCASKGSMLAKYALEGLPNKVLAAEYRTTLPDERTIAAELHAVRQRIQTRSPNR